MTLIWVLVVAWHPLTQGMSNSPPPIEIQWFETEEECEEARRYHWQHIGKGLAQCFSPDDNKIDWLP